MPPIMPMNYSYSEVEFSYPMKTEQIRNFSEYFEDQFGIDANVFLVKIGLIYKYIPDFAETELIHAMYYVNKLADKFKIENDSDAAMLTFVSLILANKFLRDVSESPKDFDSDDLCWASQKYISSREFIIDSEITVLKILDYNCTVNKEDYEKFKDILNNPR